MGNHICCQDNLTPIYCIIFFNKGDIFVKDAYDSFQAYKTKIIVSYVFMRIQLQ